MASCWSVFLLYPPKYQRCSSQLLASADRRNIHEEHNVRLTELASMQTCNTNGRLTLASHPPADKSLSEISCRVFFSLFARYHARCTASRNKGFFLAFARYLTLDAASKFSCPSTLTERNLGTASCWSCRGCDKNRLKYGPSLVYCRN